MGFLKKLFGGGKKETSEESPSSAECPHTALVPRWDAAEDMGKTDKITHYICEGCGSRFSREEGEQLIADEEQRIRGLETERAP